MKRRKKNLLLLILKKKLEEERKKKITRRYWVRKIFQERKTKGEFHLLIKDLKLFDNEYFFKYFRMSPNKFEELLALVAPLITKECKVREPICPAERLCVTLRHLVTGDSHITIATSYRMSPTTVGRIIKETCSVIWKVLLDNGYLKSPTCEEEWLTIATEFERKWNYPNCVGAIDGKHVVMQAPPRSGSVFYNYKGTHSIVLMAVVNANYEFSMVDVGDAGRQSDGGVFANCHLGYAMTNNKLNLPPDRPLNESQTKFPYVFVGDEAFPLKTYLMKPYPKGSIGIKERVANYRLSRARRIVENAFGICATRFRIFRRPIISSLETVVEITKAVVVLHNFLMCGRSFGNCNDYCPFTYIDQENRKGLRAGDWRNEASAQGLVPIPNTSSNNFSRDAKKVRDDFRDYFNSPEGSVSWQLDTVNSTLSRFDAS